MVDIQEFLGDQKYWLRTLGYQLVGSRIPLDDYNAIPGLVADAKLGHDLAGEHIVMSSVRLQPLPPGRGWSDVMYCLERLDTYYEHGELVHCQPCNGRLRDSGN